VIRPIVLAIAGTGLLAITTRPQTPQPAAPASIEVDAVVLDKDDRPVRGLRQADFQIKEDGRSAAMTTFTEVSAAGIAGQADGRSVVLLLDDNGVALNATTIMQNIARLFVSLARPSDAISAIRLTHREDEAAGGLPAALERIDEYRAGSLSFFGREMREDTLLTVARVARQLEPMSHRRKALVCIGARDVCDPYFEVPENSILWKSWRDAVSAAARANASVYVVSPAGVTGRVDLGGGLADITGGGAFVRSNDFGRDVKMIWDEASHYYLLGYTSSGRRRDLHTIDVSVKRSGLHVRARQRRGD
jgi:VWFA-related protein